MAVSAAPWPLHNPPSFKPAGEGEAVEHVESVSFNDLPTEMVVKVMELLGPSDLTSFALSSKRFLVIFKAAQATIMATVLKRQPEINTMLYLYTATEDDFCPGYMLHPRIIDFDPNRENRTKINFIQHKVAFIEGKLICPEKITLDMGDICRLWNKIKVVDWWVQRYPALRWRYQPEDRRFLRSGEEARLRKAVARWWLYSKHFHGEYWRDLCAPRKWYQDYRLHHIRIMSTREILELEDLWGLMFDTISRDLCSSPDRVQYDNSFVVDLVRWGGDEGRHNGIVGTYLKLNPERFKHFSESYNGRRKVDIISAVSATQRHFGLDRETLSLSINAVLQERMMLKPHGVNDLPQGGIIDSDRSDVEADHWDTDGWSTGNPPLSLAQINAFPAETEKRVPYGDDGSDAVVGGW